MNYKGISDAEFLMRISHRISAIDWETAEEYHAVCERIREIARNMYHGRG